MYNTHDTAPCQRHDNRTVANTTRYPEGGTSRTDWTRKHQKTTKGEGRGGTRRERAKPQAPKPPEQTKREKTATPKSPNSSNEREEPRNAKEENHTRSAQAMANHNRDIQGRHEMHGREARTQTHHIKHCTKELESMSISAQSADRHTHTQSPNLKLGL